MNSDTNEDGKWILAAPQARIDALRPLILAHERKRRVQVIETGELQFSDPKACAEMLLGADGLLLVGDRRRSPRSVLPGPFLQDADGRRVSVGWLPDVGNAALHRYALAAARVARRTSAELGPIALLGQWQARFLYLVDDMQTRLSGNDKPQPRIFQWTADRITRENLARGLGIGLGAAIYFGHGRPSGWAGYQGFRTHHFLQERAEPLGSLLSVTCRTASRWKVGLSFSESIVLQGMAASALGAVVPVEHVDNIRWMIGLAAALRAGEKYLGKALCRAAPNVPRALHAYRIIGDPLALLVGAAKADKRAARILAPSPEQVLL